MTDTEALKKKLGKWAGFVLVDLPYYYEAIEGSEEGSYITTKIQHQYYKKGNLAYRELPDFTESLDACLKHLFPRLWNYFIGSSVDGHTATVWSQSCSYSIKAETPALAFCLATEKLLDAAKEQE